MRSRANSFPRARWRSTYRSPPPPRAMASWASTSARARLHGQPVLPVDVGEGIDGGVQDGHGDGTARSVGGRRSVFRS